MFSLFALSYYLQLDFFATYFFWILLNKYSCSREGWEEAHSWLIHQKNEILALKMWLDWSLPIQKKKCIYKSKLLYNLITGIQWKTNPHCQLYISISILKTIDSEGWEGYLSVLHYSRWHMTNYVFPWTFIESLSEKSLPSALSC